MLRKALKFNSPLLSKKVFTTLKRALKEDQVQEPVKLKPHSISIIASNRRRLSQGIIKSSQFDAKQKPRPEMFDADNFLQRVMERANKVNSIAPRGAKPTRISCLK